MNHSSTSPAAVSVRTCCHIFSAVALLVLCSGSVRAQYTPVWSDSFAVSGSSYDVNYQHDNGTRQTGALAPIGYVQSPAGADYHHELGSAFGTNLMLKGDSAATGLVSPNRNFNGLVNGRPVGRISFQMQMALINDNYPNYSWAGFSLGANAALTTMMSASTHFGVRMIHDTRYGAGNVIQFYDGATQVGPNYGFPAGISPTSPFTVHLLITDTSDSNPWNGSGSTKISMYVDSHFVGSYTKGGGGYVNNYLTLEGGMTGTVSNGNLGLTSFDQLTVSAASTNIYISSSSGNDLNYGDNASQPLATFDNLDGATLLPGTTIHLKRGDVWPASLLHVAGKGTPGNPITLTAYGEGPSPRITGANLTNAPCVQWENPSYVNINSLDLRDAKVGLYLRFTGNSADTVFNNSNVVVTACHFENMNAKSSDDTGTLVFGPPYPSYGEYEVCWGAAIWLGGRIAMGTINTLLDGLTVTHCGFKGCSIGVGTGFYWPDTPFHNQFTNMLIEDCWSSGTDNGIIALHGSSGAARRLECYSGWTNYVKSGTSAAYLQGCVDFTVTDCEFKNNIRNRTPSAPDGCGFDFEGACTNCTFSNNVIHDNDGQGILVISSGGDNSGLTIINNTWYNNARNASGTSGYELHGNGGSSGSTFSNNGVYPGTDTANGPVYLYNALAAWNYWAGWSSTNRMTVPYSAVSNRPLTWDFANSVQGWAGANQWSGFAAVGGALVGTSTGGDPFVYSAATWTNTREYRWVHVRMSQTAGNFGKIYFQTETAPGFAESKTAYFPIIADGQMRDYIVPVGPNQNCHGVVTGWRLDPTDAAGSTMVIDAFEAMRSPYLASVTQVSGRVLNVSFNQAMLPDNGVFNPANYTLNGPGRGTLASQPDSVSLFAGSSGPVFQLKWNNGIMSAAPAVLAVSSAQNSRGIHVWSGSQVEFTVSAALLGLHKADNTDNLNLTTSWTGGVVPGAADIAQWNSTVTTANATVLGANLSFGGLKVTNPGGPVTIGSGNTQTLGNYGIDLSGASQNLTISSGLTLGTGQTWTVNTGRSLTHNTGAFTRNTGATLLVDQSLVSGTVTASPTLVNGVLPWGFVRNGGAAAVGSGNGFTLATVSGGNVVPYTGATAATTGGTSTWGGIPSGGTGLVNYDVSIGTPNATGLNRNINTLRYIGGAAAQNGNTAATLLNVNCILNAGTGTLTIGGGGTPGMGISSSSSANELVLAAANADITFGAFSNITNNGANATSVTVTGPYNVTLLGTNTYTGDTTVNSDGTLVVDGDALANAGSLRINGTGKDGRGKVEFTGAVVEAVDKLFINGVQMAAGTYGATGSGATHIDDIHFAGSGVTQVSGMMLQVMTGSAIPAGYETWASTNAPSSGTGADFDGDGVANGAEYVLGGDKNTNDLGKLPTAGTAGANFVFTFNRAKASNTPDTTVKIEMGNNLAAWPVSYTVGTSPEVTVTNIDANWEQVTLTIVRGTDPAKFARLKVEVN